MLPVTTIGGVGEVRGTRVELDLTVGAETFRLTQVYTIDLMDLLSIHGSGLGWRGQEHLVPGRET